MTRKFGLVLLVLSMIISTVLCQTFQYSRGWTNGKRSNFPNLSGSNSDVNFTNDEIKRLKMLIYGNADEPLSFSSMYQLWRLIHGGGYYNYASQLQGKGQSDDSY